MLYLEDYLEMIEQLPMDLRDRFTEMREMDLQVQSKSARLPVLAARVQCQTYLPSTSSPLLFDSPPAHWLVHKEL
nr:inhibitor of growth protein 3-like [Mirounga angustirostris]